jgi:membrane associated rhomboid family serine protease
MSHPLYQQPEAPQAEEAPKPRGVRLRLPGVIETPYLTYALLAINIGIFLLQYLMPEFYEENILFAGFSYTTGILRDKEFYRLFTAMFLHANLAHLALNMLSLYSIGASVERYFGHLRFILIYLLGGILGSLLMLFVSEAGLGASGAIFAIFGAQIVFLYLHRGLFGEMARAQMWRSIWIMGFNFLAGFAINIGSQATGANIMVGNAAHIGGAIGGAVLAWFIGPRFVVRPLEKPLENGVDLTIDQSNKLSSALIPLLVYLIVLASILFAAVRFIA